MLAFATLTGNITSNFVRVRNAKRELLLENGNWYEFDLLDLWPLYTGTRLSDSWRPDTQTNTLMAQARILFKAFVVYTCLCLFVSLSFSRAALWVWNGPYSTEKPRDRFWSLSCVVAIRLCGRIKMAAILNATVSISDRPNDRPYVSLQNLLKETFFLPPTLFLELKII